MSIASSAAIAQSAIAPTAASSATTARGNVAMEIDTMKIEAPWGNLECGDDECLPLIEHCKAQLEYYLKHNTTPRSGFTLNGNRTMCQKVNPLFIVK